LFIGPSPRPQGQSAQERRAQELVGEPAWDLALTPWSTEPQVRSVHSPDAGLPVCEVGAGCVSFLVSMDATAMADKSLSNPSSVAVVLI
jgi:hypothetical protein